MQCLPLWLLKICAYLTATLHTQGPQYVPSASDLGTNTVMSHNTDAVIWSTQAEQTALVIKNANTNRVESLAPLIQSLPLELNHKLVWYSIQATVHDIDTLKNKIQYCMHMKTVDKAMRDALTPDAILDFCGIISASQPPNKLWTIITQCPLLIAHEIVRRTMNINEVYAIPLDEKNPAQRRHTSLLQQDPSHRRHTCLLQEAVIENNANRVQRLLELGANPNILNVHGYSIHDYVNSSQINIRKLLEDYKKKV